MNNLTSLRTMVRTYIVNGIAQGILKSGDKISEQRIADSLDVSRTPTREAMLQLNSEGFLDYQPRRGFYIKMLTDKEKSDIYEATAVLDSYCARVAMNCLTPEDIQMFHEIIDKIDVAIKYKNINDYKKLQLEFHAIYRNKCYNSIIYDLLTKYESGVAPSIFISDEVDDLMKIYTKINMEHREIVRLFESKDVEGIVVFLLETHWSIRWMQLTDIIKTPLDG